MSGAVVRGGSRGMPEGGMRADVVIVGAGPAGLAAAEAAARAGADALVLEREAGAGGILPQCVHDGFGLHLHKRALTGPEYAEIWFERARAAGARFVFATTVLGVERSADGTGFRVDAVGQAVGGRMQVACASVVVATGCRERVRGALGIPGTRPSGVMTAGEAQYLVNRRNLLPGRRVVVLGSGDIGLIMARRMTLEGAQVRLVLGAKGTGLLRNHVRCIQDHGIPFREGWGVMQVHGKGRLSAVTVAPLAEDGSFDRARRERVSCDVLLLACGLIPEREVIAGLGDELPAGVFVCGNAERPHDLVDQVTQEGIACGAAAAAAAGCAGGVPADLRALMEAPIREPKGRLSDLAPDALVDGGRWATVCTACPVGCIIQLASDGSVQGNRCARGMAFACDEMAHPRRLFTGTVRVEGSEEPLLPVRTSAEVPREMLSAVAQACRSAAVRAPVAAGEVVIADVGGLGVDVVAAASRAACAGEAAGVSAACAGEAA